MLRVKGCAVVLALFALCLIAPRAHAGDSLNLKTALPMIAAAEKKAEEIKVPMVITVLDAGGNMIAQHRMDDALLVSVEISLNKAYSALAVKIPTSTLGELAQPGKPLYGIQNCSRMIIFGGGFPVVRDGVIIGAIGVSGGSVEEDMACAKAGLAALK
ncbi:MAG: heme-binding protein [Desulfovibrionaceae bacterium]